MSITRSQRTCVIGAGSSGIAACQVLHARGIPFDCFEKGSQIGGNWRYRNDNGASAAYRSLHINTSRGLMAYRTFPMPTHLPPYPSHFQIAQYFDSYVDHFGFREHIAFRTEVTRVAPTADGEWEVTFRPVGDDRGADAPLRGRARRQRPSLGPTLARARISRIGHVRRRADARAQLRHAGYLRAAGGCWCSASATPRATSRSRRAGRRSATFLAMRRGAYVIPKFIGGKPVDETSGAWFARLPLPIQRTFMAAMLKTSQGRMTDYGLPAPDHQLLAAHPTVSSDLLPRIGHGDIAIRPNISRFDGGEVVFTDGSREAVDLVIYCTGYKISFPFFDPR